MLIASTTPATLIGLMGVLRQSVASERVDDDLLSALDEVLVTNDLPTPAVRRRFDALLTRLPYRPRRARRAKAAQFSDADFARLSFQFRRATPQFIVRAEQRVHPTPHDLLAQLQALHDAVPKPNERVSYLRRYAIDLLTILDLVGDDEA